MRRFFCAFIVWAFVACGLAFGYGAINRPEGVLRVGIGAEPATLDPALATGIGELRVLSALYEGLVTTDGMGGILPGVAESWDISANDLSYIFHLRKEATWSDGSPLTAWDFEASYKRAISPELAAPNAPMFDAVAGAKAYRTGTGNWAGVGIKAVEEKVLVIALEKPSPTFLITMASSPIFYPVPISGIMALGEPDSRSTHWTDAGLPTNGPFVMKEHRVNSKILVKKDKQFYYDQAAVKLSAVEFYPIDNRASEEMAFVTGLLDVTMALPLNKVPSYRDLKSPYLRIDPALQVEAILINTTRPPLDKLEVRRALAMSLDRYGLCESVLRAGQEPAYNFVPAATGTGFVPLLKISEGAEKDAATILKSLASHPLTYRYNSSDARKLVAETLQAQWNAVAGAPIVKLENLEWKTFLSQRAAGDYDLARIGWSADFNDPSNFLEIFLSDSPNNTTGWKNAEYDALVKTRQFPQAEKILMTELPVIPLYFNPNVYLLHPRVSGWIASPTDMRPWKGITAEAD